MGQPGVGAAAADEELEALAENIAINHAAETFIKPFLPTFHTFCGGRQNYLLWSPELANHL